MINEQIKQEVLVAGENVKKAANSFLLAIQTAEGLGIKTEIFLKLEGQIVPIEGAYLEQIETNVYITIKL